MSCFKRPAAKEVRKIGEEGLGKAWLFITENDTAYEPNIHWGYRMEDTQGPTSRGYVWKDGDFINSNRGFEASRMIKDMDLSHDLANEQ